MGEVPNEVGGGDVEPGQLVPVFPLPSTVLLPRVVLPLHIFEMRYRRLMEDALAGPRAMCIALLKPGYEAKYHTLDAEIHPVVGVGRIVKVERTSDGRFYFLIQGACRARVAREDHSRLYRRAELEPIEPRPTTCEEECSLRRELRRLLQSPPLEELSRESRWLDLFKCGDLSFSDLLDALASSLLTCAEEKLAFLAEPCVRRRAAALRDTLRCLSSEAVASAARCSKSRHWPPTCCEN
jgi:Lon protease-like protein